MKRSMKYIQVLLTEVRGHSKFTSGEIYGHDMKCKFILANGIIQHYKYLSKVSSVTEWMSTTHSVDSQTVLSECSTDTESEEAVKTRPGRELFFSSSVASSLLSQYPPPPPPLPRPSAFECHGGVHSTLQGDQKLALLDSDSKKWCDQSSHTVPLTWRLVWRVRRSVSLVEPSQGPSQGRPLTCYSISNFILNLIH